MFIIFSLFCFSLINLTFSFRNKREIWSINSMAQCQLGYPAWNYIGYGCWCGPGNADVDPVDEIDE